MKKLIGIIAISVLLASSIWAGTYTTNFNLYKPRYGTELDWGANLNRNFDIIDSILYSLYTGTGGGTGGSMTWPITAGVANYNGSSGWGPAYNASNPIPTVYLNLTGYLQSSTLMSDPNLTIALAGKLSTTGTAASAYSLAGNGTNCNTGEASAGI